MKWTVLFLFPTLKESNSNVIHPIFAITIRPKCWTKKRKNQRLINIHFWFLRTDIHVHLLSLPSPPPATSTSISIQTRCSSFFSSVMFDYLFRGCWIPRNSCRERHIDSLDMPVSPGRHVTSSSRFVLSVVLSRETRSPRSPAQN